MCELLIHCQTGHCRLVSLQRHIAYIFVVPDVNVFVYITDWQAYRLYAEKYESARSSCSRIHISTCSCNHQPAEQLHACLIARLNIMELKLFMTPEAIQDS